MRVSVIPNAVVLKDFKPDNSIRRKNQLMILLLLSLQDYSQIKVLIY